MQRVHETKMSENLSDLESAVGMHTVQVGEKSFRNCTGQLINYLAHYIKVDLILHKFQYPD